MESLRFVVPVRRLFRKMDGSALVEYEGGFADGGETQTKPPIRAHEGSRSGRDVDSQYRQCATRQDAGREHQWRSRANQGLLLTSTFVAAQASGCADLGVRDAEQIKGALDQ